MPYERRWEPPPYGLPPWHPGYHQGRWANVWVPEPAIRPSRWETPSELRRSPRKLVPLRCPVCDGEFLNQGALERHVMNSHPQATESPEQ
jgi:hypothetical protein